MSSNIPLIPADGQPITTVDELNEVLVQAAGKSSGNYEIDLAAGANIELTTELKAINLQPGVTLDIKGNGATLDGKNETTGVSDNQRGLFVYSGVVTIENLTVANTTATGGTGGMGGGGGAGMGGGLFIANDTTNNAAPGNVTLNNVNFQNDTAVGGQGGQGATSYYSNFQEWGGGGGLGGNGNSAGNYSLGGGGGIGSGTIIPGVASGAGGTVSHLEQNGGGGGGGIDGGGAGQTAEDGTFTAGGQGGFGGGGGAGDLGDNGGFGGGGGGSDYYAGYGSNGGYGGGGGSRAYSAYNAGGFGGGGGGYGDIYYSGGGGGGLGAGGDVFVMDGAMLTIAQGSLTGGQAIAGKGGFAGGTDGTDDNTSGTDGQAYGGGIFLQGGENINFTPVAGAAVTISDVIADEFGSGGGGVGYTGHGKLTLDGAGALELDAVNTFAGGVTIESGTLEVGAGGSAGSGAISLSGPSALLRLDAVLAPNTTTAFGDTLNHLVEGYQIDLRGLGYTAGATATVVGTTLTVTSGGTSETFTLDSSAQAFKVSADGADGTPGTLLTAFATPSITGTVAGQTQLSNTVFTPFSHVTIGDLHAGATETLTITLSDPADGTLADGTGFAGTSTLSSAGGVYTLTGTLAALTAELDALAFHAGSGTPGSPTPETTTFTLDDLSSSGYTASDSTTTVAVIAAGNAVPGPGVGATIDVGGLAYSASELTSFTPSGTLTVNNAAFGLTGVAGEVLLLASDGVGGTTITAYATLSDAITAVDGQASGSYTIQLTADSVETADPAAIDLASGVTLAISGANGTGAYVIDGGAVAGVGGHAGLVVAAGTPTLQSLAIENTDGAGLLLQDSASASFVAATGTTQTVAYGIAEQNGHGSITIGTGALTGTVDLTGNDTYTGATVVNGGTLVVDGAIAGSAVEVNSGATFVPGEGPDQITVAGLTLASGSAFQEQIGGTSPGSTYDQTIVLSGGAVALNGATLDVTSYGGFVPASGDVYTLIDNRNSGVPVTGVFDDAQGHALTQGSIVAVGGVDFRINYFGGDGNDVTLTNSNFAPTLAATADNPAFIESAQLDTQVAAVTVFAGANASTIEPGQSIIGLNLTVAGLQDGADETVIVDGTTIELGGASSGTTSGHDLAYSVSLANGTAAISFSSGGISDAVVDGIIDGIAYQNTNENDPTGGGRTITVSQLQDNGGTANGGVDIAALTVASTVTVVPVNYAPSLTATATDTDLNTAGPVQPIATPFANADAGSVKSGEAFSGFSFTVQGLLDGANEAITVDGTTIALGSDSNGTTAGNGLTYAVSLANDTATVTLSSSGVSTATIDGIIDGLTYADTLVNATAGDRTITLTQIQESGGSANGGVDATAVSIAATVELTEINNAPTATAAGQVVTGLETVPVNTATAGYQDDPQIAALKDGGYVVVWQDGDPSSYYYDSIGSLGVGGATGDSSGSAVKAQIFSADGTPEGSEILVNTTTAGNQYAPAITTLDDGDFVITWINAGNVDGQLFSAAGAKEGAEFQVNTSGSGYLPSIAALAGGGFAVVWMSGLQLEAQTFAADGTEVGSQIHVGSFYSVPNQPSPAITALSGGGFAVTWGDLNSNVETQAFSATGTPTGTATVLGADIDQIQPAIAALNNGNFVVTWSDAANNAVNAQILSATGAQVGPLIHVDQVQIGGPPEIATLSNGDFVITWTNVLNEQYYTLTNLMAQVFTPDGEAAISPITISSVYDSGFGTPDITALPNGQFAVTYGGPYYVTSSVYTAAGAFVGSDLGTQAGGEGTPAVAIGNNSVAFAWPDYNGNDLDISATSFLVGYQEIAGHALNLKNAGLSVGDVDGLDGIETLTLSVTEGVLNVAAGGSEATVTGSGSGLVTIDGTIAEINALLNTDNTSSISFTDANPDPAHHVTLTMTMDDHGNSGAGGALTGTDAATIEVAIQLVNTVPGVVLAQEGVPIEVAGLSVIDRDAETLTTTLQVYNGALTVGAVDGASVSGSGTQEVTVSGTLAQVDAVLSAANNVLYQGNFYGLDYLEMTSNANGNFAYSGPETATSYVSIAVGVPAMLGVVVSGTGITNGSGDVNAGHVVTLTFEMSDVVYVSGGTPVLFLNDGGSATYSGGSGTDALTFTYQVMPGDNTAALEINGYNFGGASFQDAAGNNADLNDIFVKLAGTLQIDTTAPTVSVAADHTALVAGQTSTVTFTFSEAVSNFALGDATATGGSLGNLVHVGLNGSNQDIYTATFTPDVINTEAGSVAVNASSYADLAGNNGAASNTLSFTGDTLTPTVAIAADHTALLAGQTAAVTFTFSEPVASFALADTSVSGGSLSDLVHVGLNSSNQDIYTATFTPDATNNEVASIQVDAASFADASGNAGAASNTVNFSGDTLAPSILLVTANPNSGMEAFGAPISIDVAFGEAVTVAGGTPTLSLNDNGTATYDAAATAALHDPTKLVFDYVVGATDAATPALAVTGIDLHGAAIDDLAGNAADLGNIATTFSSIGVENFNSGSPAAFDFNFDSNGNGHADILAQSSSSGAVAIWESGQLSGASTIATSMPSSWHLAGVGDFDGNGKGDILWTNDDGSVAIWDGNNAQTGHTIATGMAATWHLAGTGDFNGDGKTDILWQNDNGSVAVWDSNNAQTGHTIAGPGSMLPTNEHVVATGDFSGDGTTDILWQNTSNGALTLWSGENPATATTIATSMPSSWHVAGVGDFAGNGKSDLLWQNDNGTVAVWDNDLTTGHTVATGVPSSWQIAGVGDFNGDGKSDILWHNSNGAIAIWDSGVTSHTVAAAGVVPSDWHIIV
jgi:hypothetical protein